MRDSQDQGASRSLTAPPFDLTRYLSESIEQIVKNALASTLRTPAQSAFLLRYAKTLAVGNARRDELEAAGEHIPLFLIATITDACNLHCAGCFHHALSTGMAQN
ncbi:MAG: hypothetical protein LBV68_00415 [Spirochaetaceae bacterium]|nr:hypothetical protein [Spirochaetaceae bacterium]